MSPADANTDGKLTAPPRDMLIGITNRCNHKCVFCAHHLTKQPQGEIDAGLARRILGEAYVMGVRRVGLYTTGEMFMCKALAAHVRNAKEIGYEYIYTDTNGALATEANLREIITAGIDSIKFSINAARDETYAALHGHDDFAKVIANLKTCHRLKGELNPELKIMVSFVVTKQTEAEMEMLREITAPYIDVFMPHAVRPYMQQHDHDIGHLKTSYGETATALPCPMVFNRIHVTHDGHLTACCIDHAHDLILADLKTVSLDAAWTGKNAVDFRRRHLARDVRDTMCHGCSQGKYIPYQPLKY